VLWIISPTVFSAFEELLLETIELAIDIVNAVELPR